MSAEAPVLVTGATGFVGRELVRELVQRGVEVHALARGEFPAGSGIVWHKGDLLDARAVDAAVEHACRNARARVVHSAALISYATRDRERQRAVNVEGTRNVLAACEKRRVERLCFVSSVVAVGPSPDGKPLDERSPFSGAGLGVDYMDTKREAEELVLAARDRLDVVVVNPGAVFGPAERKSNTVRFLREVAAGRKPIAAPPGSIAVVGIHDTALGILLALERGRRGERYLLVERSLPTRELFNRMCRELGCREIRWTLPHWIWPAVVAGARLVDRIRPLEFTPPQALVMLGQQLEFDTSKARDELGWRPQPFDEILSETVQTLRERGVLPGLE